MEKKLDTRTRIARLLSIARELDTDGYSQWAEGMAERANTLIEVLLAEREARQGEAA